MVRREYFYGIAKLLSIGHFMKWGRKQNGMPRRKRNEKCEKNRIKNTLDEHNNPTVDKFFCFLYFICDWIMMIWFPLRLARIFCFVQCSLSAPHNLLQFRRFGRFKCVRVDTQRGKQREKTHVLEQVTWIFWLLCTELAITFIICPPFHCQC